MIKRILIVLLILVLAGAALWTFGPREPVDLTVSFDPAAIGDDPDRYLEESEAKVPNLRPGAVKEIVWAYPKSRARTPLSIVYIHGFSATKEETRPLADEVAAALDANLFYTRLTGHGRDGAAMAEASVNDWLNDLAEAIAIGRDIGNRVVVVATSTGATLATLAAAETDLMEDVAGLVAVSPNFALRDWRSLFLDMPFAREILPLVAGETYGFTPLNPAHGRFWTTQYPTTALLPMAALIRAVESADLSDITVPALFVYSPNDRIVDPAATRDTIERWGAPHAVMHVEESGDPTNHVIAGRILSPSTTDEIAARIVRWIESLRAPEA